MARVLALCFLVIVSSAIAEAPPATQPATQPVRELAVVRNYEDLLKQPAIDLPSGRRVRLGIETLKAAPLGGALVYCLADEPEVASPDRIDDNTRVCGPVLVRTRPRLAGAVTWICKEAKVRQIEQGPRLYAAIAEVDIEAIPVEVLLPSGEVLAAARLKPEGDPHHDWFRWSQRAGDYEALARKGNDPTTFIVHNASERPVWPAFHEEEGLERIKVAKLEPERPSLPRLATLEPDPDLKLTMRGMTLTLRSDAGFDIVDAREEIVARWWVNGVPYRKEIVEPIDDGAIRARMEEVARLAKRVGPEEVRLELRFIADRLGAKKGDRIKLQLMHAPYGSELVRRGNVEFEVPRMKVFDSCRWPRMSNAVEFTAE